MVTENNRFKIMLWIVVFFAMVGCICELLTMASTIANVLGLVLLLTTIYISIKTQCFTKLKIKKNEKNN